MANRWRSLPRSPEQNQTVTLTRDSFFGLTLIYPGQLAGLLNRYKLKGLILAQNERWRRGLGMQVEREELLACFEFGQRRKGE